VIWNLAVNEGTPSPRPTACMPVSAGLPTRVQLATLTPLVVALVGLGTPWAPRGGMELVTGPLAALVPLRATYAQRGEHVKHVKQRHGVGLGQVS